MLQFLVGNGNATTVSGIVILHPAFLPQLLSGCNHKWYWGGGGFYSKIQNCSTIFDKENLKIPAHYSYIKTIKFECTDKPNS
jgi:hypothetical protein